MLPESPGHDLMKLHFLQSQDFLITSAKNQVPRLPWRRGLRPPSHAQHECPKFLFGSRRTQRQIGRSLPLQGTSCRNRVVLTQTRPRTPCHLISTNKYYPNKQISTLSMIIFGVDSISAHQSFPNQPQAPANSYDFVSKMLRYNKNLDFGHQML